jgi:membrane fusion protein, copper/silver efflux system
MTTETLRTETPPAPPSRRRRLATMLVAIASFALGVGGATLLAHRGDGHDHASASAKQQYQCPMHPTVVQDHPGDCPICGMKLVPMATAPEASASKASAPAKPQFQCPMHPTVVQDHPGDCPICGMKLVSMAGAEAASAGQAGQGAGKVLYQCPMHPNVQQDHPGSCPTCGMKLEKVDESGAFEIPPGERKIAFYRSPMDPKQTSHTPRKDEMGMDYLPVYLDELQGTGPVAGLVTVKIDPARQQLIGLVTAQAAAGDISGAVRTSGRVSVDETRVHRVNVKFGGFVERVQADFVGQLVQQGEPLFSIYSPELLSAQEELLLALRTQKALASTRGGLSADGDDLVASARRKLQLWDVPAATVARIEQTGQAERAITVLSPVSGVVVKKEVVPGMRIDAGGMPYELWDLSSVWVLADVYETDLQHVKVGAPATVTFKGLPGKEYQGRIAFIDPLLDPKTRTAKVRVSLANPRALLKPEMFGEVILKTTPRQALRIPADAVIDSGTRSVVFIALGDGKFQPRVVRLGASDGTYVEVQDGLAAGDKIVTRANFLIDSESRLKASLQALGGGQ